MKLNKYLIPFLVLFVACSGEKKFEISGSLNGFEGKTLYLQRFENNQPVSFDSVKVESDGSFELNANIPNTDYYRLMIDDKNVFVFVADPVGELELEVDKELGRPKNIDGQEDTKLMHEFSVRMDAILLKRDSIVGLLNQGVPQMQVMELMNSFSVEALEYIHGFIDKHIGSPATLAALNNLDPTQDMPYFVKVHDALGAKMGNSDYYKYLGMQISKAGRQQQMEQEIEKKQEMLLAEGNTAPEIKLPDPSGKMHSLAEFKGKVVLIDFWASWCGPCRQENPNVVAAYKKFKNKGFEVYSVSLDKGKEAWVNAIREDGLIWTHVSDLQYWSSKAAADYGVSSIPFAVLIGRDGKILAKNLRGQELIDKLEEVL